MQGLHRILEPLRRRIATMVGRCILHAVNAGTGIQTVQVQVLADEVMDGVEHMEPYGFTSHPLSGAEGVLLNVAGQRGAAVAVCLGNRAFRLKELKAGEVALYTDEGDKLVFKRDRHVEMTTMHVRIMADEDVAVATKRYTVEASEGVVYVTPSLTSRAAEGGTSAARFEGTMHVTQDVTSDADVQAGAVSLRGHVHPENDGGGPTSPPVGG